ncbi:hypothetical protein EG68_10816 [Paragonimus skrjabini miyazakii]|uniref:Uncharacterized protein n=1 Tax=Paragonimus skrjabini miyazakii TaxID=59628 RepID=A0A8S9Z272_9TREM|nr:hypothetical protein EG68_10816 [Paragonimus skrjabini miyazakii]
MESFHASISTAGQEFTECHAPGLTEDVPEHAGDQSELLQHTPDGEDTGFMLTNNLIDRLRDWVVSSNTPRVHVSRLLQLLRERLPELPSDARTLMETPRTSLIRDVHPGEYAHFGLANGITQVLTYRQVHDVDSIAIHLNIDTIVSNQ